MTSVEPSETTTYCSFTKAIEHLGDRWNLLIVRELGVHGSRGFNELAAGLPGRISRSVLIERLHRLESLGVVTHIDRGTSRAPYRLTTAGEGLMSTLSALQAWSATWLPDDPAMVEREPDVLFDWLLRQVDTRRLPAQQAVLEVTSRHRDVHRAWLVLERGVAPYGCLHDPMLDETHYVYVQAGSTVLLGLATGRRDWAGALADGSVVADGAPDLIRQLPRWFRAASLTGPPGRLQAS